jgi:tripartite motif-containing protein 71
MIDIGKFSRQEKIIMASLMVMLIFVLFVMFSSSNMRGGNKPALGGQQEAKKGTFSSPRDLAIDSEGNIYIADSRNHRIQKFNKEGVFVTTWGREGDDNGKFKEPCGIDVGSDGNVYVADTWNGRAQVFTKDGKFVRTFAKEKGLWGPRGIAVDKQGFVYITDTGNCKIEKFDPAGKSVATFGKKGAGKLEFAEPFGIRQGPDNNLYIADRKNFRIQVITTDGKFVRQFKVDGWAEGQIVNGCLMEPYLSIDGQKGNIYITDSTNHRILRYSLDGKNKKVFAKDENKADLFGCPLSVAVAGGGRLFVTDSGLGKLTSFVDKN